MHECSSRRHEQIPDWLGWLIVGAVVLVMIGLFSGALWLSRQQDQQKKQERVEWIKNHQPMFRVGELVQLKVDGARVMVTGRTITRAWLWRYTCRVGTARQKRRDGMVSADTEIVAYSLVNFCEYELAPLDSGR